MVKSNKCIIAFDTSLQGLSCGIYDEMNDASFQLVRSMSRGQSEDLIPYVQTLLSHADKRFDDVTDIVTTLGPGAFTGLRLGIATAKSFVISSDVSAHGICTFDALYAQYLSHQEKSEVGDVAVVLETKRKDFYIKIFKGDGSVALDGQALPLEELEKYLSNGLTVIGDGAARLRKEIPDAGIQVVQGYELIDAAFLAKHFARQKAEFVDDLSPIYLRGADVSKPKQEGRKLKA